MSFRDEGTIVSITKSNLIRVSQAPHHHPLCSSRLVNSVSSDEYHLAIKILVPASFSLSASLALSCHQPCLFTQDLYDFLPSSNVLFSQIPINWDGEERY